MSIENDFSGLELETDDKPRFAVGVDASDLALANALRAVAMEGSDSEERLRRRAARVEYEWIAPELVVELPEPERNDSNRGDENAESANREPARKEEIEEPSLGTERPRLRDAWRDPIVRELLARERETLITVALELLLCFPCGAWGADRMARALFAASRGAVGDAERYAGGARRALKIGKLVLLTACFLGAAIAVATALAKSPS